MNEDFWKQFPPIPGFDCLKMKRDIQAIIYEEIKDLTPQELVAYFNEAGERWRESRGITARAAEVSRVHEAPAPYGSEVMEMKD